MIFKFVHILTASGENNKLKVKQEKETDSLLKLMYEVKITSNQDFITVISSIFKDKK